ncbi:MAG: Ig-like domain-containing protein [Methanobacteriota archaeon]|nr:MAG: Ig-like domain-containing protein [Euryarchaeota archaeon]
MKRNRFERLEERATGRRRLSAPIGVTFTQIAAVFMCAVLTLIVPTQEVSATYWEPQYELSYDDGTQAPTSPCVAVHGTEVRVVWEDLKDGDYDIYHRYFNGRSWGAEEEISTDIGANMQYEPSIAADDGEAHAVWRSTTGGDFDIYYRHFNGSAWQPRQEISSDIGVEIQSYPSLAAENGKVHVAWQDQGDGDYDIYYRHFDGVGWQPEVEISTDAGIENQNGVSIASNGSDVHVVWTDYGGGDGDIHYRHYDGLSWQPEIELSTDAAAEPQLRPSISAYGNEVYVVWLDAEDGDWDVYYRRFDGVSWQAEQEISSDAATETQDEPSIAAEGGRVHAVWTDYGDGDRDIYYRFNDGSIWQAEQEISSDLGVENQDDPSIAAEDGKAYVAWFDTGNKDADIYYRHFNGTGWETEVRLSYDPSTGFQYEPSLSVQGNTVHAVWHDNNDGDYDIKHRYFDGTDWQPEFEISSDFAGEAQFDPAVATDGTRVHVVWQDALDGDYDIFYRQFDGFSWLPEMELSGDSAVENQEQPAIAAEGGRIYVAWEDWEGGDTDIHYRYFDGASWQPEEQISTDSGVEPQENPAVFAEAGHAYVVWQDMEGGDFDIVYRHHDGISWLAEEEISTDSMNEHQYYPSIAVETGKVYTAWRDHGDGDLDVYYRHHDGVSWLPEMEISDDAGTENQQEPSLAVDSGRIHIVWQDREDGDDDIYYRFFNGTVWQDEMEISMDIGTEQQAKPLIAMGNGVLHVVWSSDADGDYDIYYKRGFEDLVAPVSMINPIIPYWQPAFTMDVNWTATDDFNLANITLFFRYSPDNSSWGLWQEYAYNRNISGPFEIGTFVFTAPYGEGHYVFYTVANDSSGNEEPTPPSASGAAGFDFTPPSGSIVINLGDMYTATTSVTLYLTYTDAGSGVKDVRYSNDGVWDTEPWENPSPTKSWTLQAGDGMKRVYYVIRDWFGNWSPTYSDTIELDTTLPFCNIQIESGNLYTQSTNVNLQLTYGDTGSGPYEMRISNDGVWDTEPWQMLSNTEPWVLDSGDGLKRVYFQVSDRAGLLSSTRFDEITLDTTPPTGTVSVNAGDSWTKSTDVVLDLTYNDVTSGVWRVRYSNDGLFDTEPWEAPSPTKAWSLEAGDGAKTVTYQVQDNAGWMFNSSDDIGLDTMPPTGSIIVNSGDSHSNSTSVLLSLTYSDGSSGVGQVRYSNDGVWDTEPWEPPTVTKAWIVPGGDGLKTVYFQVMDNVNLESMTYSDSIILDTGSPSGSIIINNDDGWTSSTSVSLTLTYSDSSSGVNQVRYSNDGVWDTELWEAPSPTRAWTLTAGDGIKTVYYQIMDNVSLLSPTYSDDIALDTASPTGTIVINNGDAWTTTTTVVLNLTYGDTASGVYQVRYSNDGVWDTEPWEFPSASRMWVLEPGDGIKTVYFQIVDNAGWISAAYSDDISLDSTVPVGSIVVNSGDEWTNSGSVTLTLTYSDLASGVDQVRFSNDGVWDTEIWEAPSPTRAWTLEVGDGMKVVFFQVRDIVGLESVTYFDFIGLDTAPPTGSIVINNGDSWTSTTSVTLSLMYSDTMSGVDQVRYSDDGVWDTEPWEAYSPTKAWTFSSGDGTKIAYYQVSDNAGSLSATFSDDIVLDTTPPTGSIEINSGDLWTTSGSVTLSLTYSDTGSGPYSVRYSNDGVWDTEPWENPATAKPWLLASGDGTKTAYYQVMDSAGVMSATFSDDIGLDTTRPTGSIVANDGDSWTTTPSVTLTLSYSDSGSGVYQVRYSDDGVWDTESWEAPSDSKAWVLPSGDGAKTVYYQLRDVTLLESISYSDSIVLDSTEPTGSIIIDDGNTSTKSTSVTLTLTYFDATSGVYQIRLSSDGLWDTEPWQSPSTTWVYFLVGSDGTNWVFNQVMDNAGLLSATYFDEIELDTTAPTTESSTPSSGATGVGVTSDLSVTFNEEMDQTSTETSFSLMEDTTEVPGTKAWSTDGRTLYFIPSEDLDYGTTYRIAVTTGASDASGNGLATASEITFTTQEAGEIPGQEPDALRDYGWVIFLIVIILLVIALFMSMRRGRPEEVEGFEEDEEELEEEEDLEEEDIDLEEEDIFSDEYNE